MIVLLALANAGTCAFNVWAYAEYHGPVNLFFAVLSGLMAVVCLIAAGLGA